MLWTPNTISFAYFWNLLILNNFTTSIIIYTNSVLLQLKKKKKTFKEKHTGINLQVASIPFVCK